MSFLDRSATVAPPGFNRWLVPPAALAAHMCIGQVYGLSPFNEPMAAEFGVDKLDIPRYSYSIALIMLGLSAAFFGKWVERSGPRKTILASALCFCGGLLITALAVQLHQLWLLAVGYGLLGGIGLGLGYIAPVSTLVKWFPDRPGMATGMAIMGFGSGAMIGAPLAQQLMNHFKLGGGSGVVPTLLVMAAGYAVMMSFGALIVRVPADDWKPDGHAPKATKALAAMVSVDQAWRTPQFWLLWVVLCANVTASIGFVGIATDLIQKLFTGVDKVVGSGFVGLLSLFNMGGRFIWSSASDVLGRKLTYCLYFLLGAGLYFFLPGVQSGGSRFTFVAMMCVIVSMYGGGFATIPAYLKDMFGTYQVGAIHGRLITAWSLAALLGPWLVSSLAKGRIAAGVPEAQAHNGTFLIMAGLLLVGFVANLLVRPVDSKHHLKTLA
jgi:MFS family permease